MYQQRKFADEDSLEFLCLSLANFDETIENAYKTNLTILNDFCAIERHLPEQNCLLIHAVILPIFALILFKNDF